MKAIGKARVKMQIVVKMQIQSAREKEYCAKRVEMEFPQGN